VKKKVEAVYGYKGHKTRARKSLIVGATRKGALFAARGVDSSFVKSLRASAKGWGSPIRPTLLGPFRVWKYPNPFRSRRV